ncbi:DUF4450 domain-containing protein [Desertivirga arenae]|uniref:DUF4450 domain-containing protein n=1 Tax=Desertivirga arenae TaxID=2810309 RepID=UPI001A95F56D|nr:DUF4450 domain-containing protein [Pedobacter sp. SYSU D00823]
MVFKRLSIIVAIALTGNVAFAQTAPRLWHGVQREVHYRPDGGDFVLVNGKKRFNRALYGTNTAFRVEAGDLPEFALYMPGMGGNLKFGIINGNQSKWLINAAKIETRYRPGSMLYTIKDPLIGEGELKLSVIARADAEGVIVKATAKGIGRGLHLVAAFGGATGKKFSRDGDIGADPESSFYLKPEYCEDNIFNLSKNTFTLFYGKGKVLSETERYEIDHFPDKSKEKGTTSEKKQLTGLFPDVTTLKTGDATNLSTPLDLLNSSAKKSPLLVGRIPVSADKDYYFSVQNPSNNKIYQYKALAETFETAERKRKETAERVKINTPDPYLNTLGAALSMAEDGIWEYPTYLHGAIAWRMRLNAWRGPYVADVLGLSDRARAHFSSYANSQVISPETGPVVMDTALHLARHQEKMGTSVFSSGYISRNPNDNTKPHHYDMNLVFFDQLLTHFNYTGDIQFIKEMWPALKRHLAWEKRNFDNDGDGLYDAYAAIWASDALQYSGGGVTHSSAYNYRANKLAAKLASIVGEDPRPYKEEAGKILIAINRNLWLPAKGTYAEYKDLLGLKLTHPSPGLWSIYHALDSDVPNRLQAYQALRYIDTEIPHIPIQANGLEEKTLYTLSTTNWQPYDWSLNNVALAEVLHTALAYWQGGRPEEAYHLWRSNILESMYLSSSPGGFEQLSFYDAIRGELYRDFGDPVGMAARSLTEGLFGIRPNVLSDTLTIKPGFPFEWDHASFSVSTTSLDFKRQGDKDIYAISQAYPKMLNLKLQLRAWKDKIKSVTINGVKTDWKAIDGTVGYPEVEIASTKAPKFEITVEWEGKEIVKPLFVDAVIGEAFNKVAGIKGMLIEDPQKALKYGNEGEYTFSSSGNKTVFIKNTQGVFSWYRPINARVKERVEIIADQEQSSPAISLKLRNNGKAIHGRLTLNYGKKAFQKELILGSGDSISLSLGDNFLTSGTNAVRFDYEGKATQTKISNWAVKPLLKEVRNVELNKVFNDKVTNIFKNKYLSPRPQGPTLQLPWQGIGNWCYPLIDANVDDTGLRAAAGEKSQVVLPNGVSFATPSQTGAKNIVFTSKWDNYPDSISIPLKGKSSHAYFLMAGSTNPMQTQMDNGELVLIYKDGSFERLALRNPETWWPIEQDYFTDSFAFKTGAPKPYRVYLKTGEITREFRNFSTIKGYSNYAIDGGAGTVLDLPLNPDKELKELRLKTLTNDVVIGLMAVTLVK